MTGSRLLLVSVKSRRDITWIREKKLLGRSLFSYRGNVGSTEIKKSGSGMHFSGGSLLSWRFHNSHPVAQTSNRFSARVVTCSHLVTMYELPNNHTLATSSRSSSPPGRHRIAIDSQSHCHRVVTTCNQTTLYIYICVYI